MGMVDTPDRGSGKKKKGAFGGHKKRRVGIRIDMTPMVDIAFLLLIFFMVTTVFRTPQALEINLPPDQEVEIKIGASKVVTIRILADDRLYWRRGITDAFVRSDVQHLADVLKPFEGQSEMVISVKLDRDTKFDNMVQSLDALHTAKLGKFSINPLLPEEKKEVEAL
jgi:biopolymer transport protein ExbD